jgi:hypothetical protein
MKKKLSICLILIFSLVLVYGFAYAAVSGRCDKCHTMHNSQNNAPMAKKFDGTNETTAQAHLTRASCLACHAGVISDANAPNIFGTPGTDMTAGGTFKATVVDAAAGDYHKVHNVRDITWSREESELLNATPGAESGGYTEPTGATQLTCAGTLGCHGEHGAGLNSDAGIRGFHHGSKTGYRYLQFYDGTTHTSIQGKGSSDWEKGGATSGNHNVYFAMNGIDATSNDSINALCALCHGDFHGGTDVKSGSTWTRHPTENLLSDATGWTMASVTVDYENNPFSFNGADYTAATSNAAYTTTGARVACISCHRAHGTANNDILRWDYATMTAGGAGTTGCLGCHHLQR